MKSQTKGKRWTLAGKTSLNELRPSLLKGIAAHRIAKAKLGRLKAARTTPNQERAKPASPKLMAAVRSLKHMARKRTTATKGRDRTTANPPL